MIEMLVAIFSHYFRRAKLGKDSQQQNTQQQQTETNENSTTEQETQTPEQTSEQSNEEGRAQLSNSAPATPQTPNHSNHQTPQQSPHPHPHPIMKHVASSPALVKTSNQRSSSPILEVPTKPGHRKSNSSSGHIQDSFVNPQGIHFQKDDSVVTPNEIGKLYIKKGLRIKHKQTRTKHKQK